MATHVCALILGISDRTVARFARRMKLQKTQQFMSECLAYTQRKAYESNLRNGTFPPKGVVNANLAKGAPYRFKPKQHPQ